MVTSVASELPGVEIWRMSVGKAQRVQSLIDTAEVKKAQEQTN